MLDYQDMRFGFSLPLVRVLIVVLKVILGFYYLIAGEKSKSDFLLLYMLKSIQGSPALSIAVPAWS